MKKIAIIQARMGSSRFPGKVLTTLDGKKILEHVYVRATKIPSIDHILVATSIEKADDEIFEWCESKKIDVFRGSESDVLERFYDAAVAYNSDIILRITADCPLLDPYIAGQVLYLVSSGVSDYSSNILPPTWPDGLDCEAFNFRSLEIAFKNATRNSDREHVTSYIKNNQHVFNISNVTSPIPGLQKHRWTVDTEEDLLFIESLLKNTKKNATTYDFLETLKNKPELIQPNYKRNEGFDHSLKNEMDLCTVFKNSQKLLKKSLNTIPLGSQTFSKSYIQYPINTSPFFLTHGCGSHIWDVDGNEYIDLVSGLMPNILGYNDPDVNYAIQAQLQKGISFSLSTELEIKLAERLCEIIPSSEKVRFAKNGTDVTSAAVRLARSYTNRDKIIVCGYHGWQDWYIGTTTRNKGVPKSVSDLSVSISYNNLDHIEDLLKTEEFACVIMEPCNSEEPKTGYLQGVKNIAEKYGSILVFDEIITGFRWSLGGAQKYFGVTPHLSCFGKAMGNGMPISAIVGQNHIMKEMEDIFFSGTFGGETLSIAAAIATIDKLEKEDVTNYIWSYGQSMGSSIEGLLVKYNLNEIIKICGYAPWKILQFFDNLEIPGFEIKTLFIQEMIKRGIFINSSLNINFSHRELERYKILTAFEEVFVIISEAIQKQQVSTLVKSPAIKPIFRVR